MESHRLLENARFYPRLTATSKADAVRKMVRLILEGRGYSTDFVETAALIVLKRELLGSSGIGRGVALPHARALDSSEPYQGWFTLDPPLEFESLDGEPVFVVWCRLSQRDRPGDHLRSLEDASRLLRDDVFRLLLRQQTTPEGMKECFLKALTDW